jgi:hypothetical protein
MFPCQYQTSILHWLILKVAVNAVIIKPTSTISKLAKCFHDFSEARLEPFCEISWLAYSPKVKSFGGGRRVPNFMRECVLTIWCFSLI